MIPISLTKSGLFNPAELQSWKSSMNTRIHDAVKAGMQKGGKELALRVQANVAGTLKIKRKGFLKSFRPKIFDSKPGRLPDLLVGSKVPWSGAHEHGATIAGRLVLPFTHTVGHPGQKAWRAFIAQIVRDRKGVIRKIRGRQILFVRVTDARAAVTASAGARSRVRFKNGRRAKPNDLVPVAILLQSVTLGRRIDVRGTVQNNLGLLASAIRTELDKI